MARERMVTRTIVSTLVRVKYADMTDDTIKACSVLIPTELKDDNEVCLKAVKKLWKDEKNIQALNAFKESTQATLYGMPEVEFMKYAKVLPER